MKAVRNENTGTWHLLGARGCGASPEGEQLDTTWSKIRDEVARDEGSPCRSCNWPR